MTSRVVVITGASGGIGSAIAQLLSAKGGYSLVLAARRQTELAAVASSLSVPTHTVVCDVTKRDNVENLLAEAVAKFGRVDVWVNNVGRGISAGVLDLTDDQVDEIITVNIKSALYGMQAAGKHFLSQGPSCTGHILNISSFLSKVPGSSIRSIYSASKAALNSLTANLRMDLTAAGYPHVHVTTVMPGMVTTDFGRNAIGGTDAAVYKPTPGIVMQTAEEAAAPIVEAIEAGSRAAAAVALAQAGGDDAVAAAAAAAADDAVPVEVYTQGENQHKAAINYVTNPGGVEAGIVKGRLASAAAAASAAAPSPA